MPNGLVYGGRAVNSVFAGRPLSSINAAPSPVLSGVGPGYVGWPSAGLCAPAPRCCCKGPFTLGPGETLPLLIDWSRWLQSVPGFNIFEVSKASLWDMTKSPPAPADPTIIKVMAGTIDDDPYDSSDLAHMVDLLPPTAVRTFIEVSPDAAIGGQFRFDICLQACEGCAERKITMCDCVIISIQEC